LSLSWLSGSYHPRFASLDKTNDGALSKAELAAGLATSGIHRAHIDEVTSRPTHRRQRLHNQRPSIHLWACVSDA
jgi:hypothetical protein